MIRQTNLLWHPERRGTLIVGEPRSGTHFLQKVIRDRVQPFMPVSINDEIDLEITPGGSSPTAGRLIGLEARDGYQVAIVNSSHGKAQLIADPELLHSWYVVRVTRQDKIGWFRSWAMFTLHVLGEGNNPPGGTKPDMQFLHHNTPQEVYLEGIRRQGPLRLDARMISQACANLYLQQLGDLIPADETVDYDDLYNYQTEHTWWMENQYPEPEHHRDRSRQLFENWDDIAPILEKLSPRKPASF